MSHRWIAILGLSSLALFAAGCGAKQGAPTRERTEDEKPTKAPAPPTAADPSK